MLFSQKEMATRLLDRRMRRIRRQIVMTHYLQPLPPGEVGPDVRHRLLKAGSNGLIRFTKDVMDSVYAASKGTPGPSTSYATGA